MEYESFGYHSRNAKRILTPRSTTGNIKGVELEISDRDLSVRETLDTMIEDGVLTAPEMYGENIESPVVISEDGSVYRELIIKACNNQRLFRTIKTLSEYLHNTVDNHAGTSCHIHLNDRFLNSKGIHSYDLFKTAEFMAPILYRISERNLNSYSDWARSVIGYIEEPNLFKRARAVDRLEGTGLHDRYCIVNCRDGMDTTELRIFSNHCNFEYDTIKFYINTTDFLIDLCEYMIGKSYEDEAENIRIMAKEFFTRKNTIKFYKQYELEDFFMSKKELQTKELQRTMDMIINKFEELERFKTNIDIYEYYIRLTRIIRNYEEQYNLPEVEIRFEEDDADRIRNTIINSIENEIANL